MSLHDLILGDVADVILVESDFAESVTQFVGGSGDGSQVAAIVNREEPQVDHEEGRKTYQSVRLEVSDSVSCTTDDVWSIGSVLHQTVKVGRSESGLREVWVQSVDVQSQRESGARVI